MQFELSGFVSTSRMDVVLEALSRQLAKSARKTSQVGSALFAEHLDASFGAINRNDRAEFTVTRNSRGVLITANVTYRPSLWFWIFFVFGLFTMIGWAFPLGFYIFQKSTVKSAITSLLENVKRQVEFGDPLELTTPQAANDLSGYPLAQAPTTSHKRQANAESQSSQIVSDAFSTLGLEPPSDFKSVEAAYGKLLAEYDPSRTHGMAVEIADLAKRKTVEIRVAHTIVRASLPRE